ncbi:MAG: hypothetical protein ACYCO3_08805 [Mycobacteriales bacterium]
MGPLIHWLLGWAGNTVGVGVAALLSPIGQGLLSGIRDLAGWAFGHMIAALQSTTQVHLNGWFTGPWRAMIAVAGVFAVPILLVGVTGEILAGRPAGALRRGVLAPLAIAPLLLAARAGLQLVLDLVDGACALVVRAGIGGSDGYARALTHLGGILGLAAPVAGLSGVVLALVLLVVAVLSFVIWIELAVRAALIYLIVAFIPLALAGLFWSATSRWTRRLVEILAAVVLTQLVITVVMVLAAAALAHPATGLVSGIDTVAAGIALLLLGSLALPLTLRVVPLAAEAAAVTGFGAAAAGRARRTGGQLLALTPHPATRLAGAALTGRAPLPMPTRTTATAGATASAKPTPTGNAQSDGQRPAAPRSGPPPPAPPPSAPPRRPGEPGRGRQGGRP